MLAAIMKSVVFGRWKLQADAEATKRAYEQIAIGSPERCGCLHCRNFVAARSTVYPEPVLVLFRELGIDSAKEAEIYAMGPAQKKVCTLALSISSRWRRPLLESAMRRSVHSSFTSTRNRISCLMLLKTMP